MMKFEKLITTFVDMMEADGWSVLSVSKPNVRTYIIKLFDDDEQGFEYVHGAARFIEEYYPRISTKHRYCTSIGNNDVTENTNILEITFKENVGKIYTENIK